MKSHWALIALLIVTQAACGNEVRTEKTERNEDTLTTKRLQVLDAFAEAWNRHDIDALMSMMTEDCVFEASGGPDVNGERFEGQEAVRQAFLDVFSQYPDAHWGEATHSVQGDLGVSRWTFTGRRADGSRVEVNGCDFLTFRGEKIAVKDSYRKNRPPIPPTK
jgi:ketosteroid isomerase-like protein